ncbi:MAG: hypothetical protein AAB518_03785 [Patescibacteria group bacterium]
MLKSFLIVIATLFFQGGTPREQAESWARFDEETTVQKPWDLEEITGPVFAVENGAMVIKGEFLPRQVNVDQEVRACITLTSPDFVSFAADITVNCDDEDLVRIGMFLNRERLLVVSGFQRQILGQIAVSRQVSGVMAVRVMEGPVTEEKPMPSWDVPLPEGRVASRPLGKTFRLEIARMPDTRDRARITIDGAVLYESEALTWLENNNDFKLGLFAQGEPGEKVSVTVDDVCWKYLKR